MLIYFFIVAGSFVFLTGSALVALRWALRTGQLRNSRQKALLVFDEEEPVGQMTDCFPRARRPASKSSGAPLSK